MEITLPELFRKGYSKEGLVEDQKDIEESSCTENVMRNKILQQVGENMVLENPDSTGFGLMIF